MTSPHKTTSQALKISHMLIPKRGHTLAECEDAFACNRSTMRFAVADGATEGFDSASWAQRLATKWVNGTGLLNAEDFWTWLKNEGQAHNDSWNRLDLPWYSMEKRRAGSFAAFVGVEIEPGHESQSWKGVALGDSCLVHCRNVTVQTTFPLSNSREFGSAPVLAPSCAEINPHAQSAIAVQTGEIIDGDKILLLSDATAAWYLRLCEQADQQTRSDFEVLLDEGETAISDFLELERSKGRLKDDDIAIVCIEF